MNAATRKRKEMQADPITMNSYIRIIIAISFSKTYYKTVWKAFLRHTAKSIIWIADYNNFLAMTFIWISCITTVDFWIDINLNSAVISSSHTFVEFAGTQLDVAQQKYTPLWVTKIESSLPFIEAI